ncbi:uncharacterized protein LOC142010140 [Carettochelys insculpta]|uniref:uncharacterized protein LOC142010140 n=1 Tax=Carettochelys insculpta TaxID=44489 RepID=UPI003EB857DA
MKVAGDRRPFVPLTIKWPRGGEQHVLALLDTGAEVTILHSTQTAGHVVVVQGLGGAETTAYAVEVTLTLGKAPPFRATVLAAPLGEYIIGMDVLRGRCVDTQYGLFAFGHPRYIRAIRTVEPLLRGHPKWEPVCLPVPQTPVSVKQYRIPGGEQEISDSIAALLQAEIIRTTLSAFNSPIWPVKKPDGSWRMTVDYRELNKGFKHSPTICHQLVQADLERLDLPDQTAYYHYIDDVMISGPDEPTVQAALDTIVTGACAQSHSVALDREAPTSL